MRGRKPVPTEMKELAGNPGRRPLNKNEPKPKKLTLRRPPDFLNALAKKEWRRMGKRLFEMGLLTELDQTALEMYCVSYSRWVQANAEIEKYGAVLAVKGKLKVSPWVAIAAASWKEVHQMMAEFGMSPSSRSRVQVSKTPPKTPGSRDWFNEGAETDDIDWFGIHNNS